VRARLLTTVLALVALGAGAQTVSSGIEASRDSDDFNHWSATAGWSAANGFGLSSGLARYRAPGWSEQGLTLAVAYRHEDPIQNLTARLGATRLAGHTEAVGVLEYLRKDVAPRSSLGLSLERDFVHSRLGIDDSLTYGSVALVGDHAFDDRFNVGVAGGATWFSDDNRRDFLRTRWNVLIDDRWGLNGYVKTRHHLHSRPGRPEYYSPERLTEVSLGLSARLRVHGSVVMSVQADRGHQSTPGDTRPIWSYAFSVGALPGQPLRWSAGLLAANTAANAGSGGAYRYTSLFAQLQMPL
jgi:hypothetical protein